MGSHLVDMGNEALFAQASLAFKHHRAKRTQHESTWFLFLGGVLKWEGGWKHMVLSPQNPAFWGLEKRAKPPGTGHLRAAADPVDGLAEVGHVEDLLGVDRHQILLGPELRTRHEDKGA